MINSKNTNVTYIGKLGAKYERYGSISVNKTCYVTIQLLLNGLVRDIWKRKITENNKSHFYVDAIAHNDEVVEVQISCDKDCDIIVHHQTEEFNTDISENISRHTYWRNLFNYEEEND